MHPVAFNVGGLSVHWYGILLALGFITGLWTASRRGLLAGLHPEQVLDVGPWVILSAIIGARALFVISYWDEEFAGQGFYKVFLIHQGGLVYYGGLTGACVGTVLYSYRSRLKLWVLADVLTPSIALGYVFGRIGCLMFGCCYGAVSNLPWAIHFPLGHATQGQGVHPTQVYDSLLNLMLYLGLAWLFRRRRFDGQVFATYLLGYAVLRALVEAFRGDYPVRYLGGWATPAHLISSVTFIAGVTLYFVLSRGKFINKPRHL